MKNDAGCWLHGQVIQGTLCTVLLLSVISAWFSQYLSCESPVVICSKLLQWLDISGHMLMLSSCMSV